MNSIVRFVLPILLVLGVLRAPLPSAAAGTITVIDDHGTRITLAHIPHRLISLAPNVTEILFALGLGHDVVGVSSYSNYPAAAAKLPVVISYMTLYTEKLLNLKPDLIVAAAIVPQSTVAKLRSLHLAVLVTDPHSLQGILHDIEVVGTATGASARAVSLVSSMQIQIMQIDTRISHARTHPTVFYEIDPTYLYTAGHGSFIDELITEAGGKNIAGNIANPYPQISREALLAANPDYYLLGDTSAGATPASVAARPGFSRLRAVRNHHVIPFNDDLVSRPGPRIVQGLEALARILHPELFT